MDGSKKNRRKQLDQARAAAMKAAGEERTTARCPVCYVIVHADYLNRGGRLFAGRVEELAQRLVPRMTEVRDKPVPIVELDHDEEREIERRLPIVHRTELHAPAHLVTPHRRNLVE